MIPNVGQHVLLFLQSLINLFPILLLYSGSTFSPAQFSVDVFEMADMQTSMLLPLFSGLLYNRSTGETLDFSKQQHWWGSRDFIQQM